MTADTPPQKKRKLYINHTSEKRSSQFLDNSRDFKFLVIFGNLNHLIPRSETIFSDLDLLHPCIASRSMEMLKMLYPDLILIGILHDWSLQHVKYEKASTCLRCRLWRGTSMGYILKVSTNQLWFKTKKACPKTRIRIENLVIIEHKF